MTISKPFQSYCGEVFSWFYLLLGIGAVDVDELKCKKVVNAFCTFSEKKKKNMKFYCCQD